MKITPPAPKLLGVALLCLLLAACTGMNGAKPMSQPPLSAAAGSPLSSAFQVGTVSHTDKNAMGWETPAWDPDARKLLEEFLKTQHLAGDTARYGLDATLSEITPPTPGFDMTAEMTIDYRVVDLSSGAVVFQDTETSSHTSDHGEAFAAFQRTRYALEGATRKNYIAFFTKLDASGAIH